MTLKLYFGPGACSFVPHVLLEATGAPFEASLVKLHKSENLGDEYRAINPRGQVPVLVDGDQVITQILAIIGYLDSRFPEAGFLPSDPLARARVMETLAWMNNTVHPTFTHVFMPYKFSDKPEVQAEIKSYNVGVYRGHLAEAEAIAARAHDAGREFLGGDKLGPLDVYALVLLRWGGIAGIDPETFPRLWAHVQRLAQLPPVARAMERERLRLNMYQPVEAKVGA